MNMDCSIFNLMAFAAGYGVGALALFGAIVLGKIIKNAE